MAETDLDPSLLAGFLPQALRLRELALRSEAETAARPEIERLAKELRDGLALARRQAEALPNGEMTLAESDELMRKLEAMQRGRS